MTLERSTACRRLGVVSLEDLIELAQSLGTPVASRGQGPTVDLLFARNHGQTKRGLSEIYGKSCFPLHTDMAYLVRPPKFLILMSPRETSSPTLICQPWRILRNRRLIKCLLSEVFLIKNRRFLASVLSIDDGEFIWRYDPHCMMATSDKGNAILSELDAELKQESVTPINWSAGEAVLLRNDLALHGRAEVHPEEVRYLYRIAVV